MYGDVVFDTRIGGTILSTEDLFIHLAREFKPQRILLAGLDQGVWEDYPECTKLVEIITLDNYPALLPKINASEAPDVTGGMKDKVGQMMGLISQIPDLKVFIFSGKDPGNIKSVLGRNNLGTTLQI